MVSVSGNMISVGSAFIKHDSQYRKGETKQRLSEDLRLSVSPSWALGIVSHDLLNEGLSQVTVVRGQDNLSNHAQLLGEKRNEEQSEITSNISKINTELSWLNTALVLKKKLEQHCEQ